MDLTQQQSPDDARRAQELSRQGTSPPADVPGYEPRRLLGCGAYGEVWVALDRNTGKQVAIKFYTHGGGLNWTLLSREVEKLAYLSADRYVVQLLEVGWSATPPYYVMEFVENGSLDDYLRGRTQLPVGEAVELFREIAVGLNHAHGKGVLHCDLKPANVLLDQDHRPRLADFGQSRLSHEQQPALGTLFYMAPEQAHLEAIPDAQWDVYALGAILFRMLTGNPPGRTPEVVRELEQTADLNARLDRYRLHLATAPRPVDHRRVRGVDRGLAEIVDRCLAVDPQRRYANVQEVLDALARRADLRTRWPLMVLGFIGPILLLLIMAFTGLRGYEHAVRDSEQAISRRARESNQFAAKFAARSIEAEIARYFRLIRQDAEEPELLAKLRPVAALELVKQLNTPALSPQQVAALREQFIRDPVREELNALLDARIQSYLGRLALDSRELKVASILVLDPHGRMLAAAYDQEVNTQSVGWNYAYRSYFHGGSADLDLPRDQTPEDVHPVSETHLSSAFRSSTTGTWKVAISTPIFEDEGQQKIAGVLALTINLGDFAYFRANQESGRFAALIDVRKGPNFGVILQHPLLDRLNQQPAAPVEDYSATQYRVTPRQLVDVQRDGEFLYQDPLAQAAGGAMFRGDWLAGAERVRLPSGSGEAEDMVVLIQERYDDATEPVQRLGRRLKGEGLWSLGGVAGVILVLWYIVLRLLSEPDRVRAK